MFLLRFPFVCRALPALALGVCSLGASEVGVKAESYGTLHDGRAVMLFTLRNENGLVARVSEYGAVLVGLEVPDRHGENADVTHGYDTLAGWQTNNAYLGATVGRFANRIAEGEFELDGTRYQLATNNDPGGLPCHLHGGDRGFDKVLWRGQSFAREGVCGVTLTYRSVDGEEGYPGTLDVDVTYTLTDDDELIWEARAVTDAATILNLAHHTYWNLGDPTASINGHELTLHASHYLPTNAGLIPTGEVASVVGTPMDFRVAKVIGEDLETDYEALAFGGGYDHCWVLSERAGFEGLRPAARLHDPASGRVMEVFTNQPAIQFYGGNFLDGTIEGKDGVRYGHRTALCLETQNYPDAPNHAHFPSAVLRPGEIYHHVMVHRFSAE